MSEIWVLSAKPNIAVTPQISMNVDFISNGTVDYNFCASSAGGAPTNLNATDERGAAFACCF